MGLETTHVLSDERHHGPFVCAICTSLCGLDALVTTKCSHVFCKLCLETWLSRSDRCPTCNQSVLLGTKKENLHEETMMIAGHAVCSLPLQKAQPVAHRVLKRIRVRCPLHSKHRCPWTGDYGDLQSHLLSKEAHSITKSGVVETILDEEQDDNDMEVDETDQEARVLLARSFKEEANSFFGSANFQEARDLYSKGISILKDEKLENADDKKLLATLYTNRAAALIKLKQWESCLSDCVAALAIDPSYIKAYARRNKALLELGCFEKACLLLEEACARFPKSLTQEHKLATHARDMMKKGEELLQRKEYSSAKAVFGSLLRETSSSRVVLAAARADIGLGWTDSALRLSLQVLRQDPQNVDAYLIRGQGMILTADFDKAITTIREALRLDPDSNQAKTTMKQCKRVKEAYKLAKQTSFYRKFDESVVAYTNALGSYTDLPTRAPLYSILYSERAQVQLRRKRYHEALRDSARAIYARDDCEAAWLTKAKAYHGLGRHEEARDELQDLLTRWGSNSDAIRKAYETADFEVRKQKRPDFYNLLGVSSIASLMEIKKQYKVKAMQYHPDRYSSNNYTDQQRKEAEEKFKLLGEGLEILSDDFMRQLYDEGYDLEAIRERVEAAQRAAHRPGGRYHNGHYPHGH